MSAPAWIACKTQLPEPCVSVLIWPRGYPEPVIARWHPRTSKQAAHWSVMFGWDVAAGEVRGWQALPTSAPEG